MKTKSNPSLRGVANAEAIQKSKIDCHDFANAKSRNDEVKRDELPYKSHNDKNYRRFAICFAGIVSVIVFSGFALCALLYIYDPFMFFHKPYFREQTFMNDLRISARGIIDFTEFDSVILGSSIMENTSMQEANNKLDGKWADFAISASSFNERELLLKHILSTKQIKQVIYAIEAFSLLNDNDKDMDSLREDKITRINPMLYQHNILFDFKHYLNKHTIICAFKWSKKSKCIGEKWLPQFGGWYIANKSAFSGFESWSDSTKQYIAKSMQYYQTSHFNLVPFEKQKLQDYIKRSVFRFVKSNPHTNFHFIYPAHSRILFVSI